MAGGRPSKKTVELMDTVCDRIATGESLRKICEELGEPNYKTVLRWVGEDEQFRDQYARAREAQADFLADQCIEIADDDSQDILDVGKDGDIRSITNSAAVQRAKLRVEARWKKAAQMAPKKWGQQSMAVTGADGGPAVIRLIIEEKKIGSE